MKKLKKVSNIVLIAACIAVTGYAVTATIVQIITGVELSPTLTTMWFGFWGTEIAVLATIKNCKTRHNADISDPTKSEVTEDEY